MPHKDPQKRKEYMKKYSIIYNEKNKEKIREYDRKYKHLERPKKLAIIARKKRDEIDNNKSRECITCGNNYIGGRRSHFCADCLLKKKIGNQYWKNVKNRLRGEKSPSWKGGITFWRKTIWDSKKYKDWRKRIFERDNYKCTNCSAKNGDGKTIYFEAHHTPIGFADLLRMHNINNKGEADLCDELWTLDKGITLCVDCHNITKLGRPKNN